MELHKIKAWKNVQDKLSSLQQEGIHTIDIADLQDIMSKASSEAFNKSRKPTGEEMGEILSDFANNYSCDEEGFVNKVTREHRTLQQSMFRLFVKCVEQWATLNLNQCDARNEATVILSKKIVDSIEDRHLPFI